MTPVMKIFLNRTVAMGNGRLLGSRSQLKRNQDLEDSWSEELLWVQSPDEEEGEEEYNEEGEVEEDNGI